MTKLATYFKGPAVKISQRNHSFYFFPAPSRKAVTVLGFENLSWSADDSEFAGFNRTIDYKHVAQIVTGLQQPDTIVPNPIIVYFLHENLKFTPTPGNQSPAYQMGEVRLMVPQGTDPPKIGFVIDGQHRVKALGQIEHESDEDDIPVGIIAFHAPSNEEDREVFDKIVLEQMEIINSSKPLSDNDKLLVRQRLDRVSTKFGGQVEKASTANLILKDLDGRRHCPIKFKAGDKAAPKGSNWLNLSVWVTALEEALSTESPLRNIFKGSFSESRERREQAARILDLYFRAIYGLIHDKGWWEKSPKQQRLYHNVGIWVLLRVLDEVNVLAKVFSSLDPGRVLKSPDEAAIKHLQKALKPIRLLDWSVGFRADDDLETDDITQYLKPLKMAQIQWSKGIKENLHAELLLLMQFCRELQDEGGSVLRPFVVKDNSGVPVCVEEIQLSKESLDQLDAMIEDGEFLVAYPQGARASMIVETAEAEGDEIEE